MQSKCLFQFTDLNYACQCASWRLSVPECHIAMQVCTIQLKLCIYSFIRAGPVSLGQYSSSNEMIQCLSYWKAVGGAIHILSSPCRSLCSALHAVCQLACSSSSMCVKMIMVMSIIPVGDLEVHVISTLRIWHYITVGSSPWTNSPGMCNSVFRRQTFPLFVAYKHVCTLFVWKAVNAKTRLKCISLLFLSVQNEPNSYCLNPAVRQHNNCNLGVKDFIMDGVTGT